MSKPTPENTSVLPPEQQPQGVHIGDLRKLLFETINGIKDGTMRIERAKSISDLSQVIINSAKVEVDFIKATGGKARGSGFMDKPAELPAESERPALPPGINSATVVVDGKVVERTERDKS